jgi:hypothetical protein
MASTYSTNLKIELIALGDQAGTWGTTTNTNIGTSTGDPSGFEQAIVGYGNPVFIADADLTIALANSNATQVARNFVLNVTSSGSLTATRNLIVPTIQKPYLIRNNTTGSQSIVVKTSAGTGITVPTGARVPVYVDGTNVVLQQDFIPSVVTAVTQTFGDSSTLLATTAFVQAAMAALHPVGSIYINATNATNPGTLLGFGTWTAFGAGRVPVGFDAGNVLFDTAEETGGSADATLPSHTHTATVTDPEHQHYPPSGLSTPYLTNPFSGDGDVDSSTTTGPSERNATTGLSATAVTGITVANSTEGASATNANYQPYITVFMWKRTV